MTAKSTPGISHLWWTQENTIEWLYHSWIFKIQMHDTKGNEITSSSTALTCRSFSACSKSSVSLSLSRPGLDNVNSNQ